MPIGTDLILQQEKDPESIRRDGRALGTVIERAARRYRTLLAFPLMDLTTEKIDLLALLGVQGGAAGSYHFSEAPSADTVGRVAGESARPFPAVCDAAQLALRYIAEETDLLPVGMLIGPFSLMTRLLADPITAVALAGSGVSGRESAEALLVERILALALITVLRSAEAQIRAGARRCLQMKFCG